MVSNTVDDCLPLTLIGNWPSLPIERQAASSTLPLSACVKSNTSMTRNHLKSEKVFIMRIISLLVYIQLLFNRSFAEKNWMTPYNCSPSRPTMNACLASSRSHVNGHHLLANLVIPLDQQRTMQVSLAFSPTLGLQHSRLAATDGRLKTLTLGYISQIDASQLNRSLRPSSAEEPCRVWTPS
jgi:hypothetical protein